MPLTLLRQQSPLAVAAEQRRILESPLDGRLRHFDDVLAQHHLEPLRATGIDVLQINLGKLCNQTCRHCHVDAGPERREVMSRETIAACLEVLAATDIPTVDVTGGAPEMNPHFRWLVAESRKLARHVIDRCNLTILLAPGFEDLATFLAEQRVEVVASLPCYLAENVDRQRGDGVFARSLVALRRLNALGYGAHDSGLTLTLVYNPVGAVLPPRQDQLEMDYRSELADKHGIVFTRLHTITNMPISRFLDDLLQSGKYEAYMEQLIGAFNPAAAQGVMCRSMISVDWQGNLFDCDFNQMLELGLSPGMPAHISEFDALRLVTRRINTGRHCFGCTAGAGSGCQGAVVT
jgi:radical SAM/Cys-rich protein